MQTKLDAGQKPAADRAKQPSKCDHGSKTKRAACTHSKHCRASCAGSNVRTGRSTMAKATFNQNSKQPAKMEEMGDLRCGFGQELIGYYDPAFKPNAGELHPMNAGFRLQRQGFSNRGPTLEIIQM